MVSRLKTAYAAASRREFERRLDPSCWSCRKEDAGTWLASGPAGNLFRFRPAPNGEDVEVTSASGGRYLLAACEDGIRRCSCPSALKSGDGCKHRVAFEAVKMAAAMAKETAK